MIPISAQVESKRRIWKFIVYPLLFLIAALFLYLSISDQAMDTGGSPIRVFGYLMAPVHTSSLEPALSEGDAVLIDATPADQIEPGDIIVYHGPNASPDIDRVSSSREVLGVPYYTVEGGDEEEAVAAGYIYGTVSRYLPYVGGLLDFLDSTAGTFCCIGLPLLLLILLEIISSIRRAKRQIREKGNDGDDTGVLPLREERRASSIPDLQREEQAAYQGGSFSPQYAYHPQQAAAGTFTFAPVISDPEPSSEQEMQEQSLSDPALEPPELPAESHADPENASDMAQELPEQGAVQPDPMGQKLSLTLGVDETSEFTVNGINIVYEDDTLNLDVDPKGVPMRIRVRMRDDEAQLLLKMEEKTTRFDILNREGKPRRISISGKDEEDYVSESQNK